MAKIKVVRTDGSAGEYEITPLIQYAFEQHKKKGFHKAIMDDQMQSDIYWLCWECIRRSGETVKPFGEDFVGSLASVEILESDPLA